MFFVFILLVILSIIVIHFLFQSIRVIFDMDKNADTKMDDAKISADGRFTNNSNYK
jgi:Na+-transporting methylmalonyl-CoA/oxaloacetate decarboxylase gamma subunit